MRRSTPDCSPVAVEQRRLVGALDRLDCEAIARVLEEFVTDARRERLRAVIAARMNAVTIVMDAPHDPHNGAAVLRSCDAFGVQRVHVVERRESFLIANSVARGSERWVDVCTHATAQSAIDALRASGHELVATHPAGELDAGDLAAIPRLALVLGNERDGIHAELAAACARSVRIPMRGFAESLNVSVTGAILLHRATSDRPGDLAKGEQARLYARALVLTIPHAAEVLAAKGLHLDLERP